MVTKATPAAASAAVSASESASATSDAKPPARGASRVVQLRSEHFPTLLKLGIPFKDVTDRERKLKLMVNELKCQLSGDSTRFFTLERAKVASLSRVAELAKALPLDELAAKDAKTRATVAKLRAELRALGKLPEVS